MASTLWYALSTLVIVGGLAATAWAIFFAGSARGRLRCPGAPRKAWGVPLPRLRGCWYDMSAAQPDRHGNRVCPECAFVIRTPRDLYRRRRRWDIASTGAVVALVGVVTWSTPMLRSNQWQHAAPTILLAIIHSSNPTENGATNRVHTELVARARHQQLSAIHIWLVGPNLVNAMRSVDPWDRIAASELLAELGQQASHLEPGLLRFAQEAAPSIEWAQVFGAIGSERSVQYLIACHQEEANPIISARYARALARVGGEEALRELLSIFEDKPALAQEAFLSLQLDRLLQIGFFGRQAGDLLAEAEILLDPAWPLWTPEEQVAAHAVLSVLRGDAEHISTALVQIVDQQSTQSYAAPLLRRLGPDAAPAAEALGAAAESWSRQGREVDAAWALRMLRNIGYSAAPTLGRLSTCGEPHLEREAREILQAIRQRR